MVSTLTEISKPLPPITEKSINDASLEDIDYTTKPVQNLRKASSTISFQSPRGLGITIPRRPSDTMISRLNSNNGYNNTSRVCNMERPNSNDSLASSPLPNDFSDNENSRNSSITNESITGLDLKRADRASPLYMAPRSKFNSTSTLVKSSSYQEIMSSNNSLTNLPITPNLSSLSLQLNLTPSQRYRFKKQGSKLTLKNREKLYDEMSTQGEDDDFEDDLIWNVPFTKGTASIFSSTAGKPHSLITKIFDQSTITMPMSPLPGSTSVPSSPMLNRTVKRDMYSLPNEAQSISEFYQASSTSYFEKQFRERQNSCTNLPRFVQEATVAGLEDSDLVSSEKIRALSSSRPIWLPPKASKESKKHEREILKTFEKSAKFDKEVKLRQEKQCEQKEKSRKRWIEVSQHRKIYKYASDSKILAFKTCIPQEVRLKIWTSFLEKDLSVKFESFEELNAKFAEVENFPRSKLEEVELLVSQFKKTEDNEQIIKDLTRLLKLRMISTIGLNETFDHIILYSLLIKFSAAESFYFLDLLKEKVFSDSNIDKFTKNLTKNAVVKKLIGSNEFKDDLESLGFEQIYPILLNFINNSKFMNLYNLLDILVIYRDEYKIFYSIFITVLRDYHFGFTNLKNLNRCSKNESLYINEETSQFVERIHYYHKKF